MKHPIKWPALLLVSLAGITLRVEAAPLPLRIEKFEGPSDAFISTPDLITIRGPMSIRAIPASTPTPADTVIELDYFCVGGMPSFVATLGPPFAPTSSRQLPPLVHSETWNTYASRISTAATPLPDGWKELRLDLPLPKDRNLQIRNIRLRPERPGEFDTIKSKPAASSSRESLQAYLDQIFPATISKVSVGTKSVRVEGNSGGQRQDLFLADIPMDQLLGDPRNWHTLVEIHPDESGDFLIDIPRHRQRDGLDYDRLTSRWQLVKQSGHNRKPISHARYAEWVACRSPSLPPAKPSSKKGLGGWRNGILPNELKDLGISAVTVNMLVHSLVSLKPGPGTTPTKWQGKTYHIRQDALSRYDQAFIEAHRHGVMVSAILLLANPAKSANPVVHRMGHPDAIKTGTYAMPNITSAGGIGLYGAVLNFMAERWSRADARFGRVHHWIIHNEVDAGWVWTNAGNKPDIVYMDLYQRSMRLTDLIARQYDSNSRPFISLTHHWAERGNANWYGSKRMIELLTAFTRAEGDFPWALAYHPYPQNLHNPRTWEDKQATFSFNTRKITPKNIEVLDAYMKQPGILYHGKVRPVHLSENGFNSKDYSPKELEDQAAGMAMAWKKISTLSSIQSWQYHNWIDNRSEGGLRIGLRKFPDAPGDPLGKKPIWYLYQALGTPQEDALSEPYLKTIGISSWSEIIHRGPVH